MPETGAPVLTRIDEQSGTGVITLNRPPLNILDVEALGLLGDALERMVGVSGCTFVVIGATGEKAFCAGADVGDHLPEKAPGMLRAFHRVARYLNGMDAISIAAVRGVALGAGFELAMCCDLVVASETASFGQPEINLACFPPIAVATLPTRIGRHRAADVVLTGRRLAAREAESMGLVTRVTPAEDFDKALDAMLGDLRAKSRSALRIATRALRRAAPADFDAALERAERSYVEELLHLQDAREGIEAFIQKRKPEWSHR